MALQLARGETILFPMPYVEAERPPYVVTNQRLIEQTEMGDRVLAVKSLIAASRAKARPYASVGVFFLFLALAVGGTGGYFYFSVMGMQAAPYKALLPLVWTPSDDPEEGSDDAGPMVKPEPVVAVPSDRLPDDPSAPTAEQPDDAAYRLEVLKTRTLGMGLLGLGAAIGLLGLRIFGKKSFFVVCRTRDAMMRIRVDGKVQQDIILATLQAVQ